MLNFDPSSNNHEVLCSLYSPPMIDPGCGGGLGGGASFKCLRFAEVRGLIRVV